MSMMEDTIFLPGKLIHPGRNGQTFHHMCSTLTLASKEHYRVLGRVVDGDPSGQAAAPLVVQPMAHHLRARLDRLCILLVSSPAWSTVLTAELTCPSAIMKVYALLTLHETGWGTRAGVGDRKSHLSFLLGRTLPVARADNATATIATQAAEKPLPPVGHVNYGESRQNSFDIEMNGRKH